MKNLCDLLINIPHEIVRGTTNVFVSNAVIDSRKVGENALFICLRGLNVDGHRYIMEAAQQGAVAFLVEDKTVALPENTTAIYVENARKAMGTLAANFHGNPASKLRLIGVTGTNGKTTSTHFIENVLRFTGRVTGLIGTAGVQVQGKALDIPFATATTPDPLELHQIFAQMLDMGVQDVVMEVSSHALALYKMEGLTFEVGAFTNLTQDHLDFHGTMENYAEAKAQLFAISRNCILNADDGYTPVMREFFTGETCLYYSLQAESDLRGLHAQATAQGMVFDLLFNSVSSNFTLPMLGKFNVYNALATIGVAHLLGIGMEEIQQGVAQIAHVPGRIQTIPNTLGAHIIVDYAHSPDGLDNIIKAVREMVPNRVITLFGCGGDRDTEKRPQMGRIAGELSDYLILTSDNPRTEDPHTIIQQIENGVKATPTLYEIYENRKAAIFKGVAMLKEGDALIIAGKGHEDYQIIGTTKHHFDDSEVAREALCDLASKR
ncbi:MAG: UDP-N-acetylmuramoyl-L-alanyl-D-glutamate--2,6-diaminopimelate ligase [Defluviitaleaceae bacterium]|nr:UDP-N-acetylmuramoyl-L-alanyl-D-glutamate--2,6-diaminopimelate ligase [Defluviitaleaceae bacterium]MCL2275438.1 UDP-N-acetylmuramoyl-L-alanyl-D-glutamate--2,6-diaminopimelate ligase [Defluviitaleaceae bacterium]